MKFFVVPKNNNLSLVFYMALLYLLWLVSYNMLHIRKLLQGVCVVSHQFCIDCFNFLDVTLLYQGGIGCICVGS
jgi:hypothetical protein